jgi:hypothetical protein
MSSYNNYLKFKEKYLNLKKKYLFSQIGGNPPEVNDLIHYIDSEYRPDIKKIIWKIDTKNKYNIHVYNILNPEEQITLALCNEDKEWKKLGSGTLLLHGLEGSDITRIFKILSFDGINITLLNKDGVEFKNTTQHPNFNKFQIYTGDMTALRLNKHFFPEEEDEFGAYQSYDLEGRLSSASSSGRPYYSGSQRDASALDWGGETVAARPIFSPSISGYGFPSSSGSSSSSSSSSGFSSSGSSSSGSSSSGSSSSSSLYPTHGDYIRSIKSICTVPGRRHDDTSPFKVIPNSGSVINESGEIVMGLQCFWISIFNYLQRNPAAKSGRKIDSVRDLRTLVGLGEDTTYTEFDEDNPIMKAALQNLVRILNLQIIIHYIDDEGKPIFITNNLHGGQLEGCYEFRDIQVDTSRPVHIVHITQHMQFHFQLITTDQSEQGSQVAGTKNHFLLDKQVVDLSDHQVAAEILKGWNSASTEIRVLEQDLLRLLEGQDKTSEQEVKISSIIERIDELRRQLNKIEELRSAPEISALQTKTGQINEETERLIAQYASEDFAARKQLGKLEGFSQEEFGSRPSTPRPPLIPRSSFPDPATAALIEQFALEDFKARQSDPFKVGDVVLVSGKQAFVAGEIPEYNLGNFNYIPEPTIIKVKAAIATPTSLPAEITGEVAKVDLQNGKYYYIVKSRYGWFFNVVKNIRLYQETV